MSSQSFSSGDSVVCLNGAPAVEENEFTIYLRHENNMTEVQVSASTTIATLRVKASDIFRVARSNCHLTFHGAVLNDIRKHKIVCIGDIRLQDRAIIDFFEIFDIE